MNFSNCVKSHAIGNHYCLYKFFVLFRSHFRRVILLLIDYSSMMQPNARHGNPFQGVQGRSYNLKLYGAFCIRMFLQQILGNFFRSCGY